MDDLGGERCYERYIASCQYKDILKICILKGHLSPLGQVGDSAPAREYSVNIHFELFVQNRGIYRNLGQLKEKNHFSVDIFIQIASTLRTAASCIFAHLHHDDIIDYIFKSMYMERCLH